MLTGELSTPVGMSGEMYRGVGTTNYNDLENKPTYNGHIIEGDLSSDSLGIWQPKDFSIEEQNTGVKWINGKPLYRKVVVFNNIPKNGDIDFDIMDGENYMLITGKLSDTIPFPYIHGSAPANNVGGFFNGNKWSLRSGNDAPATLSGFMIIQYTKTTD